MSHESIESVANPGSTLGEAIGALIEKEVNRLLDPKRMNTLAAIQAIQYKVVYDDEEIMSAAQAIQQNTLVDGAKIGTQNAATLRGHHQARARETRPIRRSSYGGRIRKIDPSTAGKPSPGCAGAGQQSG
jgi:hypothetical protein